MTRKEAKKLEFLPVPEGFKMRYRHFYKTMDGKSLAAETFLGSKTWWIADGLQNTSDGTAYNGPRRLDSTVATLLDGSGNEVAEGDSLCNPKDTPNKRLGRCIAHNRCIKAYHKANQQPVARFVPRQEGSHEVGTWDLPHDVNGQLTTIGTNSI